MKKMHQVIAILKSNNPSQRLSYDANTIDEFFDHLFYSEMAKSPQTLSSLGIFETFGIREHNAYLNCFSPEVLISHMNDYEEYLKLLNTFEYDKLSDQQKISYKIFEWMLHNNIRGQKFLFHTYVINQMDGALNYLEMLLSELQPLEVEEDFDHFLARLSRIPDHIDQLIDFIEYQQKNNIVMPSFAFDRVISTIEKTLPADVQHNIYYARLLKQEPTNAAMLAQAKVLLEKEVYPAYEKLKQYFIKISRNSRTNHGLWALPDGDEYYDHVLRYHTTTNFTADEIHALGLKEVAHIHAQMRTLLNVLGASHENKSMGDALRDFAKDESHYFADTDQGRQECIDAFTSILERSRKELGSLFDLKPKSPMIIKPVPSHSQEGAPAAYYFGPSVDGKRPGIFFINIRNMKEIPKYHMETLTIHEAEPGHHFQVALATEMEVPSLRKLYEFTAYVEGWALYVEKLAYEENFYSSPAAKLGHLSDELLRAARLVVDTGIHRKRWSREQAIEYMQQTVGMPGESAITEVERYFVLPGQACAYKIGQLKILELRDRAKKKLANAFKITDFHNVVLSQGAVPLSLLEEMVEEYIKEKIRN